MSPGNADTKTIKSRISAPTTALRFPVRARMKRRGVPLTSTAPAAPSVTAVSTVGASIAISGLSRPRVEDRRGQVGDQDADEHGQGVEEEEALHEGQIVVGRGRIEEVAEARVGEEVLDDDRATEHVAELHGEAGQVG